jgi:hypothetical protein
MLVPLDAAAAFEAGRRRLVYAATRSAASWRIGNILFSDGGGTYRTVFGRGARTQPGSFARHQLETVDPDYGEPSWLSRNGDEVTVDGVPYAPLTPPREVMLLSEQRPLRWLASASAFHAGRAAFIYRDDRTTVRGIDRAIFSPDGGIFHALGGDEFTGNGKRHTWRFEDPFDAHSGVARRNGDELIVDGVTFTRGPLPTELTRMLLPPPRTAGDVFDLRDGNGTLLYQSAIEGPRHKFVSVRLWVGPPGVPMRSLAVSLAERGDGVSVQAFERREDTGMTTTETEVGPLVVYWPDRWGKRPPTLGGRPLTRLNLGDFVIREPAVGRPTLTPRLWSTPRDLALGRVPRSRRPFFANLS